MKTKLIFLLIPIICFSQEFMNSENQWLYKRVDMQGQSFYRYKWSNDTIINNDAYKSMDVTQINYRGGANGEPITREDIVLKKKHLRQVDNSIVYYDLEEKKPKTIMLQTPAIGNEWTLLPNSDFPCLKENHPQTDKQKVTNLGTSTISNHSLSFYEVEGNDNWTLGTKIYNQIGGETSLFPRPGHNCDVIDGSVGYPFKLICFSNSVGTLIFDNSNAEYCELLSTDKIEANLSDELIGTPNPVIDEFIIISGANLSETVSVYNSSGKLVAVFKLDDNKVNLNSLPSGIYFLKLRDLENNVKSIKILKK